MMKTIAFFLVGICLVLLSFRYETQHARNDRLSDLVTSAVLFSNCSYNERGGNFDNISTEHRSLDSLLMNSPFRVIKSCLSMKVLDLMDSSTKAKAPVATLDFNYGGNQLWFVEKVERGYLLHPWYSKMVIGINPENNSVVQQEYNGNDNQIWIISGKINSARLLNYATQKYLTVDTNKIDLKNYLTSPSQLWNFLILGDIQKEINTCNCLQNFEYAKNLMETSYPGFNDKVNAQTKSQYDQLLRLSYEKAGATKNFYTCFKIINRYLSFFQDNHIQFWMTYGYGYGLGEKTDSSKIRKFYSGSELIKINEQSVLNYFNQNRGNLASIEGIWENLEGNYRCAIIKDNTNDGRDFFGFVLKADNLSWMPGQVKMDFYKEKDCFYTLYYYTGDHSVLAENRINCTRDILYERNGKWVKKYPIKNGPGQNAITSAAKGPTGFQLYNYDDSTLIFTFPNCNPKNKNLVDDLIKTNRNKILQTPYLIIDLRGNGGGLDETWNSVIPFLYTGPYKIVGNDLLSSKSNIEALQQTISSCDKSDASKIVMNRRIKLMKENIGEFVVFASDHIFKFDEVMPKPRKIAILIDNKCASSAEEFLLHATKSKKVILLGQTTSGTLDYSNLIPGKFPSKAFNIFYPLTRRRWLPNFSLDKEKIKPNIYIDNNQNWIEVAAKNLKSLR